MRRIFSSSYVERVYAMFPVQVKTLPGAIFNDGCDPATGWAIARL
jgi:hypothetical protein